jgi:type IX secretion system PorP/SprF family membrane protein
MKKITHMIIIPLVLLVLLFAGNASAQQDAMYSQYMFNMMSVNPAYAGSRELLSVTGLARAQWRGIEGAPTSQTLSIDGALRNKKVGLGLNVFNDKIAITNNTGAYGVYAYRLRMRKSTLAMGMQLGIVQYRANLSQATLSQGSTSDDRAFQANVSTWIPSAGAGIYLSSDRYYIGASLPNLYSTQIGKESQVKVNKYDHLFAMAGYVISFNEDFKLKPSVLFKAVKGAPLEWDLNANFWMYDKLGLGLSYRTGDALVAMVEIQVANNFRVGYAYDYTLTALQRYTTGSHELLLRYEFGFTKDKILTPRYF